MKKINQPLLNVLHVDKFFPKIGNVPQHVLKNINITLYPGSCAGIVGASGSGKSTLARMLCLIHRPEKGAVFFKGEDIFSFHRRKYYQQVQMVFQDPLASFPPRMKVEQYLLEPFRNYKLFSSRKGREIADGLMDRVNLSSDLLDRYPSQLSGGQLQRIVFARACSINPELIICDEPTSALDVTIQAQIISLFKELRRKNGFASLFITHDLALAEDLCDIIHVMDNGAIVETLTTDNMATEASHPVTMRLVAAAYELSQTIHDTSFPDSAAK